jgi:hypothetical protein
MKLNHGSVNKIIKNKKDMNKDKIEKIGEVKSKILSNKAEAIAFMQMAGIFDDDRKLKESYK